MGKVVIKILQDSAVTQNVLGGLTIYFLVANFVYYICQKLWKLADSRQSYCKNYLAYFFLAHPVYFIRLKLSLVLPFLLSSSSYHHHRHL